jgi:hypothetical protein
LKEAFAMDPSTSRGRIRGPVAALLLLLVAGSAEAGERTGPSGLERWTNPPARRAEALHDLLPSSRWIPLPRNSGDPGDGTWAELAPPFRYGHAAVRDPVAHRMIVWGGHSNSEELWSADLATGTWTRLDPEGEIPVGRGDVRAVYDAKGRRMIVLGGTRYAAQEMIRFDDVWELSLVEPVTWRRLEPAGPSPPARAGVALVHDPVRNRVLMHGGHRSGIGSTDELWALSLDGTPAWSLLAPRGEGPGRRYDHVAVYDSRRDRIVVQGGGIPPDSTGIVWSLALDDTTSPWSRLAPPGISPGHRQEHVAAYDSLTDRLVLIGGAPAGSRVPIEAWQLPMAAGGGWEPVPVPGGPLDRRDASLVVDPVTRTMFLYGGVEEHDTSCELWRVPMDGAAWTRIAPSFESPRAVWQSAVAHDERRNRMIAIGTLLTEPDSMQVFALPLDGGVRWERLRPAGPQPVARSGATIIYDPVDDRIVMFGGVHANDDTVPEILRDVWSLSLDGEPRWDGLRAVDAPLSGRIGHGAVYDPVRHRMVVFGGYEERLTGEVSLSNSSLVLHLGDAPRWSALEPAGAPPEPRLLHSMVYDARGDRVVVYSGNGEGDRLTDVWELSLGDAPAWRQLLPAGEAPLARDSFSAILDPVGDRLVVHGGFVTGGPEWTYGRDVWAYSFADDAWRELHPAGSRALGREHHAALYDPRADRMLVFGGNTWFDRGPELWELAWNRAHAPGRIRLVSVEPIAGGSRVTWRATGGAGVVATVERGDGGASWFPIGEAVGDPLGTWVFEDRQTRGLGHRFDRLVIDTPTGRVHSDPVRIEDLSPPAPILLGAGPNPTDGSPTLRFTLWSAEPATLEIHSVAGKRIGRFDVGSLGSGHHRFPLQGRIDPLPGIYVVRLMQAGHVAVKKMVIL